MGQGPRGAGTSDSGFIVAGISESTDIAGCTQSGLGDFYVAKLDSAGAVTWQKMFGGSNMDYINAVRQTSDGGYVVAGSSQSADITDLTNNGGVDCYLAKLADDGTLSWQVLFGDSGDQRVVSVRQTGGGGYALACVNTSWPLGPQWEFVETDSSGTVLRKAVFGGTGEEWVEGSSPRGLGTSWSALLRRRTFRA